MKTELKKVVCFFFGHKWKAKKFRYSIYHTDWNCLRCKKKSHTTDGPKRPPK